MSRSRPHRNPSPSVRMRSNGSRISCEPVPTPQYGEEVQRAPQPAFVPIHLVLLFCAASVNYARSWCWNSLDRRGNRTRSQDQLARVANAQCPGRIWLGPAGLHCRPRPLVDRCEHHRGHQPSNPLAAYTSRPKFRHAHSRSPIVLCRVTRLRPRSMDCRNFLRYASRCCRPGRPKSG